MTKLVMARPTSPLPPSNLYALARKRRRRQASQQQAQRLSRRMLLLGGTALLGRLLLDQPFAAPWNWTGWAANLTPGWLPRVLRASLLSRSAPSSVVPATIKTVQVYSLPAVPQSPAPLRTQARELGAAPPLVRPVQVERITINGIPLYRTTIDLKDPETFITLGLAKNATRANSHDYSVGDEPFLGFVQRYGAAVVANATFFSKDHQKRVMGNMVAEGRFLKYSRWENYGTTLGLRQGRQLEMVTARTDGRPHWQEHWFSLTGGPRLLREGQVWIAPKSEGFRDPSVLGVGSRTAIGFPKNGDKLILATFLVSMTLEREAHAMKDLGCYEAMNLDGGTSGALAHRGKVLLDASRPLTNVLVVYDREHPAPQSVKDSWLRFQAGERPVPHA